MLKPTYLILTVVLTHGLSFSSSFAQESSIPYSKIYSNALNGDIPSAIELLNKTGDALSVEDQEFKTEFLLRFKGKNDASSYLNDENIPLFELQSMFRDYWRKSLLNPEQNYMGDLGKKIVPFLMQNYPPIRDIKLDRDSIGVYLSRYIHSIGLYTQEEVDVSGHLLDLLVWQNQSDTLYSFKIGEEELEIKVRRMRGFITLGWRDYATLGSHYPGGWATKEALFMVEKAYDINSEHFEVSFLAHEGKHYLDLREFPELENVEMEYRAKLIELSIADSTLIQTIEFFIENSNRHSEVPHVLANYELISDISYIIFKKEFENDINSWKKIDKEVINKAAAEALIKNTKKLLREVRQN